MCYIEIIQGELNHYLLKTIREQDYDDCISNHFLDLIKISTQFVEAYQNLSGKIKKQVVSTSMMLVLNIKISNEVVIQTLSFMVDQLIELIVVNNKGCLKIKTKSLKFCW
jgi:hypothetical protein